MLLSIFNTVTTLIDVIRMVIPGINIVNRINAHIIFLNGNLSRAKAYAAIIFINKDKITAIAATKMVIKSGVK